MWDRVRLEEHKFQELIDGKEVIMKLPDGTPFLLALPEDMTWQDILSVIDDSEMKRRRRREGDEELKEKLKLATWRLR